MLQRLKWCFVYCIIFLKCYKFCKEDVVFLLMAEGFLLVYDRNKEMKETRYIYFEDLVLMFLFEQVSDNLLLFIMYDLTNDLIKFMYGEFVVCLNYGDSWKVSKKTCHLLYVSIRSEDLDNLVCLLKKLFHYFTVFNDWRRVETEFVIFFCLFDLLALNLYVMWERNIEQ